MKKIYYFTSPTCAPCRTLGPIMESLSTQINFEKIDVSINSTLAHKLGVRGVPTLVLIENGVEKGRLVGLQTKDTILNFYKNS